MVDILLLFRYEFNVIELSSFYAILINVISPSHGSFNVSEVNWCFMLEHNSISNARVLHGKYESDLGHAPIQS